MRFDQANNLRNLLDLRKRTEYLAPNSRVITVTSGKGGVGKTNFAANLAVFLSDSGISSVVIDADLGLANIEILLGCSPRFSLFDVMSGEMNIPDAVSESPWGVRFISGGNGLREIPNISNYQLRNIMENLVTLDSMTDVILIDTGAGISEPIIKFVKASSETIIICTPEPTSITDAYSLIKTTRASLESGEGLPQFRVVVNQAEDEQEGYGIFKNLHRVADSFLDVDLNYLGFIPFDYNLIKAVKQQVPVMLSFPETGFSKELRNIGAKLIDRPTQQTEKVGMRGFVRRLAGIFN